MTSAVPKLPAPHADLVKYIAAHSEKPLKEIIEPYRKYEAHLRQTFAQEPDNELLKDPYVNMLPLFTEDTPTIKIRARNLASETEEEASKYIMPLPKDVRRPDGSPAVVASHKEFQRNFNVFSESSLVEIDWSNVIAAGSSVVNCLVPVPDEYNGTKRGLREFYHEKFCPASDVDLFLYGLTEEEALKKIQDIETSVRDVLLTETTTVRTKHAITICSQYPTRHIQIVLRIYNSISEILTGFDIDCSGAAYDGKQVYCTPRALESYMTQINHIDLTRRSPSYENRLSKYSHRGFEVYWPDLDRSRIDPTVFERSFQRTLGLARLLVLERLPTPSSRDAYLDKRRAERGRPRVDRSNRYNYSLAGNIKEEHEDEIADWVNEEEVSNYHTFTIPYGPKFHAKKIEKLCYTRDLLLNAEWNQPESREVYLHRHPAFFGRVEDVIGDCCGYCPIPKTEDEKEIAEKEAKIHVSGKISFIKDDPGRQQIGSFNPLTDDDWTEMAYVGNTARLCTAIVDGDVEHVEAWLAQEGVNPDTRDFTGRTPLHLAVMSSTPAVVKRIVDAGARLVARLADGRTALHLAAARGNVEILKILMDKSIENEAEYEEKKDQRRKAKASEKESPGETKKDADEQSGDDGSDEESDDDSEAEIVDAESEFEVKSMATGSFVEVSRQSNNGAEDGAALDDEDEPNFYDVNIVAWDTPCSALHLAITEGHVDIVKTLCQDYGADVLLPVKFMNSNGTPAGSLLTLVLSLSLPVEKAISMTKTLLGLGATSAQADINGVTAFQQYVEENAESLVKTFLEMDQTGSKTAINHVVVPDYGTPQTPLQMAVHKGNLGLVLQLLEHGAATEVDFESWLKSARQSTRSNQLGSFEENQNRFTSSMEQPLIVALKSSKPESALLLLEKGADPNVVTAESHSYMQNSWSRYPGESALDIVTADLKTLREYKVEEPVPLTRPVEQEGLDSYLDGFKQGTYQHWIVSNDVEGTKRVFQRDLEEYEQKRHKPVPVADGEAEKTAAIKKAVETLEKIEKVLRAKGAKTFSELFPDYRATQEKYRNERWVSTTEIKKPLPYSYTFTFGSVTDVTQSRHAAYLELFEAAWTGDIEKIKKLTLTSWDEEKTEAPLKIAVNNNRNNPFSLAFFRGHYDVAKAVLEIAKAQYAPEDKPKTRFRMDANESDDDEEYSDEDDSASSDASEPRIYSHIVDGDYTVENVGQISMKVNSRTKPLQFLGWSCMAIGQDGTMGSTASVLSHAIQENDLKRLRILLDLYEQYSTQKLDDDEEEVSGFFSFPIQEFHLAVEKGRIELLAEIIKRTGAGLPLEHLVQDSGIELKEKPRYYQGLTVYGKKRSDWATAGRTVVRRSDGTKTSPLLTAALAGCLESVEWFLSEIPLRHYLEFAKSKAAREDLRLKHLGQTPGGIERAITKWLDDQSDLVIHAAVMADPSKKATDLVSHLVRTRPALLNSKSVQQMTPLMVACQLGRLDAAEILVSAGADQTTKDKLWQNLLHAALAENPKAWKLERLLKHLDSDLVIRMLRERSSLESQGRTPLHAWLDGCTNYTRSYEKDGDMFKMLKFLFEISPESSRRALHMLDASGDTPLHTLIFNDSERSLPLARILIDFDPSLLFRENAVGRTPIEVARERFVSSRIKSSSVTRYWSHDSVSTLPDARAQNFVKKDDVPKREHEDSSIIARIWWMCEEALGKFSEPPKRRLVSLYEANDVAKRLGEEHMRSRYNFRIRAPAGSSSEDEKANEAESQEAAREKQRASRGTDIVNEKLYYAWSKWKFVKKGTEDEYEDSDVSDE